MKEIVTVQKSVEYKNKSNSKVFQELISNDTKSKQNLLGFFKILAKTERRLKTQQKNDRYNNIIDTKTFS